MWGYSRQCTGRKCTQYGVLSQSIVLICEGRKPACCVCLYIFSVVCLIVNATIIIIMYVSVSVFIQCLLVLGQIWAYSPYTEVLNFCDLFIVLYFLLTKIMIFCVSFNGKKNAKVSLDKNFSIRVALKEWFWYNEWVKFKGWWKEILGNTGPYNVMEPNVYYNVQINTFFRPCIPSPYCASVFFSGSIPNIGSIGYRFAASAGECSGVKKFNGR